MNAEKSLQRWKNWNYKRYGSINIMDRIYEDKFKKKIKKHEQPNTDNTKQRAENERFTRRGNF